ncbi:L-serine/L-threonine ammonia-lyase [Paraburkholderia caballeronis]|uniref:pyridoxal-phosphate dependent enzyme n=1 Tax=Paraburkholderia caballeronis TaxID=416943 RepID=UPI0010655820|nr:pyridoxal-phosphate dependent enzyme [Paraburkholderia caballeronis]TDV33844.1 L-serine/L-threonine ammonia-lyase [Paraburkholderia caballeronis]
MLHIKTPLILHPGLSSPDRRIWLKLENLQPSGSFKLRGIGLLCSQAAAANKARLICASGGNAGFATAFAAAKLGLQAEIIVPETTPVITREHIARLGAAVTVHGKVWDESNQLALGWAEAPDAQYVPAFDHPTLWAGHSTMIDEIVDEQIRFDTIVAAVGGGGLLAGLMTGLQRHGRTDCKVIACETEGAASFAAALKNGSPVRLPEIKTIAGCLGASEVAPWPVDAIRAFPHESVVLSDADALMGVVRYADDLRQLVEPACGVSLAVGYLDHPSIANARDVVIVVCGGVSISADLVSQWGRSPG